MNSENKQKIVISGSGLVGSLWSILLKKLNYDVTIIEKRTDPRKKNLERGRSINLIVTSRGLNAMEKAGVLKTILPLAVPVYGRRIHPLSGDTVFQPYGRDKKEFNLSISRGELNQELISLAEAQGVKIYFDAQVQKVDFESQQISFAQGENVRTENYSVLFGADGAGSYLRKEIAEKCQEDFNKQTEFISADYKEFEIPSHLGKTMDNDSLHIWPRGSHMLMALPNPDHSFTVTMYLPREGVSNSFASLPTSVECERFFQTEFPDAVPLMPTYLKEYSENPQGRLGTVHCQNWVYRNVALMGDAAHAIVPFFGQGMNSGFEDCAYLFDVLQNLKSNDSQNIPWSDILLTYQKERQPNTKAIAEMAIENFIEMRDLVGDPKFQMKKKVEQILEKEFPDLYRSRYGMITYTLIPYHLAQQGGEIQNRILDQLCQDLKSLEDVDLKKAEQLLKTEWLQFLSMHKIKVDRFELKQSV